jgi:hypothetical protein
MRKFTAQDINELICNGQRMAKKRNVVVMTKQDTSFQVETREGLATGKAGDYVAHDPISGDIWPVAADYVAHHYEEY